MGQGVMLCDLIFDTINLTSRIWWECVVVNIS